MNVRKTIYCTVTNDLNQDQRMHRICSSLTKIGYEVCLVGRIKPSSPTLLDMPFRQIRLRCFFNKGFLFYAEYNMRLLIFLLFRVNPDIIYSVDTDTVAACGLTKLIRSKKLIFDAHEYFTEVPELHHRTVVKKIWQLIENIFIPLADQCLTVNQSLADLFSKKYGKPFSAIYNVPSASHTQTPTHLLTKPYLLYQGMLNQGRGLETLIAAMPLIDNIDLQIIGEGDISKKLKRLANESPAKDRIRFTGWLEPDDIKVITAGATLGINLLESGSKSYYFSLANKFFDYMHAEVPSVNMDFPEYHAIISKHGVGLLISDLDKNEIADKINLLLSDHEKYSSMKSACRTACDMYNWDHEEKKLGKLMERLSERT
jgi:glycosyltransferase involved in cell wall biosynthesis